MGRKKTLPTKNIHQCWKKDYENGTAYFKCQKCGALISNGNGPDAEDETYENGSFYLLAYEKEPDYRYMPRPIIVGGNHFSSIKEACRFMNADHNALRKALYEKRKFRGFDVEFDNDPYAEKRKHSVGNSSSYNFVPISYCPNCGRKVVEAG